MANQNLKKRTAYDNAFPKKCGVCGTTYEDHSSFLANTTPLPAGDLSQGPKESVLSYRNCSCGSTITIKVQDMRDNSSQGIKQREEFRKRLQAHIENGTPEAEAIKIVKKEMEIPD
jgi:hypothetical protein